jgi:hypothetical protein
VVLFILISPYEKRPITFSNFFKNLVAAGLLCGFSFASLFERVLAGARRGPQAARRVTVGLCAGVPKKQKELCANANKTFAKVKEDGIHYEITDRTRFLKNETKHSTRDNPRSYSRLAKKKTKALSSV